MSTNFCFLFFGRSECEVVRCERGLSCKRAKSRCNQCAVHDLMHAEFLITGCVFDARQFFAHHGTDLGIRSLVRKSRGLHKENAAYRTSHSAMLAIQIDISA